MMGKTSTIEENRPAVSEATIESEVPTCQHHWLIETPRGATSHGHCKRCGEEREFRNSATDHLWEDESGSGYNAWRGVKSAPARASSDDDVSAAGASIAAVMV
jgi:hypothetical protein